MSFIISLILGGWTATLAMFGMAALWESCELLRIHKRVGRWLERSARCGMQVSEETV
jgi:hypothetical protein